MDVFDLCARISLDPSDYKNGLNEASSLTSSFGDKLKNGLATAAKVGAAALAAATTAAAGFAAASVKVGAEFDAAMSKVAAVSGATGEDFDALRDKAMEMGAKTKFSASESAEALNYMAMAGWKTEQMLGGLEGIMNLAAASGESLGTTSDIVTDALTAFGMKAEESGHFADILAAASSNANTNVAMMGETFKYVAPVAGAMGYKAEDVAVAIGLMANAGVKASQAGTALRSAITNLSKPTEDMVKKMAELGLATIETETAIDPEKLTKAQNKVENKTLDLEKAQRKYNDAVQEYGENSSQAADASAALVKAQNNLEDAYSDLRKAQQGETSTVLGSINVLTKEDGTMRSFSETMEMLRDAFSGLSESEKANAAATLFGKYGMSGMLAVINASDEEFRNLTEVVNGASDAYDGMGAAAHMAATMQDNLAGDITIMKSAIEGAQIVLSDKLTPSLREFVQFGTKAIGTLSTAFQDGGLSGAMKTLGKLLSEGLAMVIRKLPKMVNAGGQLLGALGKGLVDNLPVLVNAAVQIITTLAADLAANLSKVLDAAGKIIGALADGIGTALPSLAKSALDIITSLVSYMAANGGSMIKAGSDALEWLVDGILDGIPAMIDALPEVIGGYFGFITEQLPFVLDKGREITSKLAFGIIEAIPQLVSKLPQLITSYVDFIVSSLPKIVKTGAEIVGQLIVGLLGAIPEILNNVPQIVVAITDGLAKGFGLVFQCGGALIDGLWKGISDKVEWLKERMTGVVGTVVGVVKGVLGIHSPSKVFAQIGGFMAEGLGEGWDDEFADVKRSIESGLNFEGAALDVNASYSGANGGPAGVGGVTQTLNFYTAAMTPSEVARKTRREAQMLLAMG